MLDGRTMVWAGHRDQKFVAYPIADLPNGHQTLNFIAELRRPGSRLGKTEDWNRAGELTDFLPDFHDWVFDWLDVPAIIRSAPGTYLFPMVDRDPVARWTFGCSTLLGDAAHPMYPIGSNGASQAILDARVLAGCLVAARPRRGRIRALPRASGSPRPLPLCAPTEAWALKSRCSSSMSVRLTDSTISTRSLPEMRSMR